MVKLALAIGARHEGAVHAHTRLALEAGVSSEEIKQVVALAVTTRRNEQAWAVHEPPLRWVLLVVGRFTNLGIDRSRAVHEAAVRWVLLGAGRFTNRSYGG